LIAADVLGILQPGRVNMRRIEAEHQIVEITKFGIVGLRLADYHEQM